MGGMGGIDLGLGLDSLAPACEDEGGEGKEQDGKTLAYTASGAPVILSAAMRPPKACRLPAELLA